MDRDKVISLLYKYYGTGLSLEESNEIISSYCREKGKNKYVEEFTLGLLLNPEVRSYCLSYALNYYRQIYNIVEIYKQSLNDLVGHKHIILIY